MIMKRWKGSVEVPVVGILKNWNTEFCRRLSRRPRDTNIALVHIIPTHPFHQVLQLFEEKKLFHQVLQLFEKKVISPGLQLFEKFLWASTLWIFQRLIHSTMFYNIRPKLTGWSTFITIYKFITWPLHLNYSTTVGCSFWWCDFVFLNIFCQYW